ncbi:hypothetical protein P175DRAFT_015611 [Aspergillus ochraceoroseus IBT 24754]|uniref:Uncharacterized protein n=1 Tax=Aspergillus ochraceoroseus IBT 24754 TaxID=1392256 RepID=A0A2T5M634_9EURO|nr:uncharacterized protein P175DRAFT_015611 [Aspergillus ochraceoroseus IBT 24754]PTU23997.1 hypothetical protein P175DRAFT_015611 [Aspergillus ochraceoroseus IBT 24754]
MKPGAVGQPMPRSRKGKLHSSSSRHLLLLLLLLLHHLLFYLQFLYTINTQVNSSQVPGYRINPHTFRVPQLRKTFLDPRPTTNQYVGRFRPEIESIRDLEHSFPIRSRSQGRVSFSDTSQDDLALAPSTGQIQTSSLNL